MKKGENPETPRIINNWDLFKVFLASFFMQAVWNFRSLISIGFSICFFPVLDKLCETPEMKREFFQRHLKFFNAHPYFASFALGVSIRLEEMRVAGDAGVTETIDRLKDLLVSPLGAVGDRLFWATIKPAALIFGMVGIFLAPQVWLKVVVLLVTFLMYNIPHFYYRFEGIVEGYNHPHDIHRYIGQQRFEVLRSLFVFILVFSVLSLIIFYSYSLLRSGPINFLFFIVAAFCTIFLNKITYNFYLVTLGSFVLFLLVAILFL
ncbi:MAG: PTS system mannose/fructose/sorbose family transporter subunit IID [Calditrichia bacterium]|nr:PTS system mannose/fructose/sorbose family transporter subunit IID [Calditrichia bacterium]